MKPFRIYHVASGTLSKVRNEEKIDFDTLEEAVVVLLARQKRNKCYAESQYVVQHYVDKYRAKIVKIIEPI